MIQSMVRRALSPVLSSLVLLTAVPACAAAPGEAAAPAHAASGTGMDAFLLRHRGLRMNYDPARNVRDLADRSDLVVTGRLTKIVEGHVRGMTRDDPARAEHLRYVFEVVARHKGAVSGDVVHVEWMKPGFEPAAQFDAMARGADVVLYLRTSPPKPAGAGVHPPPEPVPPGAVLTEFTTPQGFLTSIDGHVVAPLVGRGRPVFPDGDPGGHALTDWVAS